MTLSLKILINFFYYYFYIFNFYHTGFFVQLTEDFLFSWLVGFFHQLTDSYEG